MVDGQDAWCLSVVVVLGVIQALLFLIEMQTGLLIREEYSRILIGVRATISDGEDRVVIC